MDIATLTNRSNGSGYRPDIDGLRAVAVSSVVIFHAHLGVCASGFVGVDIFFVISGYLIAGIMYREITTKRFTFSGFYARRARRILPALIAVVIATMIAGLDRCSPDWNHEWGFRNGCAV
jgi:peptidoglycan/LPS O-acetylase OafA/YrhL